MNYIVIALLITLLILCLCYLCYPTNKEGMSGETSSTKKNFKTLALYHGGCAGCRYFSADQWKKYCAAYWSFVRYAGINKAMFNLTDAGAKDDGTGLRHGDNILKYWIGSMPHDLKNSVKIGFTAYPSAKSPWTWDCSLDGQMPGDCQPSWDYTKKKGDDKCCPSYAAGGAGGHALIGTKQEGCPNNWEQIMNYIAYVNSQATPKISFMVVDGEGEGGYTIDKAGFCPIISAIAHAKKIGDVPSDFTIGVAHGKGNFCSGGKYKSDKYKSSCQAIGTDTAYPEIYWFGELTDCAQAIKTMGSPAGYNSEACTNTVYQKFKDKPQALLDAITDTSTPVGKFLGGAISEGIDGEYHGLPLNVYKYPETYPMFSTENINAQEGTKCATALNPQGGKKQCCIANYFYGEANSCGSFNGFGNWEFDKFMEFMNLWSKKFGSQSIAIYEWAFIPTAWIPGFDQIMGTSSLPSGPDPKGGTAKGGTSGGSSPSGAHGGSSPSGAHGGSSPSGAHGGSSPSGAHGGASPSGAHGGASPHPPPGSLIPSGKPGTNPTPGHSDYPSGGSSGGSSGGTSPPGSSGVDAQGRGTLFLYPEKGGFQVPDFGGFPDAQSVKKNFHTIAVVANHVGDFISQWNDPHVLELKKNTGLPVTKWLAYFFGDDSSWACMCNNKGCKPGSMGGQPKDCIKCGQAVLTEVTKDIQQHQISGILFDDEVGNPTCIVQAFEQAKVHFPSLQLGWTKALGSAKASSPDNLGKDNWDICLGQAYTDETNDFYNGSCEFASTFWSSVASAYDSSVTATRGVPMVCGAGNCIGEKDKSGQVHCTDERMSGAKISALLNSRPPPAQFKWRNFAIWYGSPAKGKGFFGCTNSDIACQTACCKGWRQ